MNGAAVNKRWGHTRTGSLNPVKDIQQQLKTSLSSVSKTMTAAQTVFQQGVNNLYK